RIKYLDITYYFMRDNLTENNINLVYKNIKIIFTNNLTKATNINKFQEFISRVSLVKFKE
ncbi:hypothetical protein COCMIDRAFT_109919, partial [Bipolaris oryzae ATCC 44560]